MLYQQIQAQRQIQYEQQQRLLFGMTQFNSLKQLKPSFSSAAAAATSTTIASRRATAATSWAQLQKSAHKPTVQSA